MPGCLHHKLHVPGSELEGAAVGSQLAVEVHDLVLTLLNLLVQPWHQDPVAVAAQVPKARQWRLRLREWVPLGRGGLRGHGRGPRLRLLPGREARGAPFGHPAASARGADVGRLRPRALERRGGLPDPAAAVNRRAAGVLGLDGRGSLQRSGPVGASLLQLPAELAELLLRGGRACLRNLLRCGGLRPPHRGRLRGLGLLQRPPEPSELLLHGGRALLRGLGAPLGRRGLLGRPVGLLARLLGLGLRLLQPLLDLLQGTALR
mmetsp:Transcript_95929/g.266494  ORF Transcript_95929/g.266494 Transcript_95929/m.266494 type:complete len:262 (-) Transcript_95929:1154-1939(-)